MEIQYCDNCAEPLPYIDDRYIVPELPCDIASANEGESAVLCLKCYTECNKECK